MKYILLLMTVVFYTHVLLYTCSLSHKKEKWTWHDYFYLRMGWLLCAILWVAVVIII